jgi:hypothetical protein
MPYLMIDLDDPKDCRRGMKHLSDILRRPMPPGPPPPPPDCGPGRGHGMKRGRFGRPRPARPDSDFERGVGEFGEQESGVRDLPLPAKLQRLKQRGLWKHLVAIAKQGEAAQSLAEFDQVMNLNANKMRSLKAIMAKLENRFGLTFLEVNVDAGQDEAGNPRYSMPPRIRKNILKLVDE